MDTYDRYAAIRDKKRYTDYRVCKLASIPKSTLYSWKAKRYELEIPTLKKIVDVLECNISDFFENNIVCNEDMVISAESVEELESRFNVLVSLISPVDIEVMREIVGISDLIEKMKGEQ